MTYRDVSEQDPSPAATIYGALQEADAQGTMPSFTTEELLSALYLSGDKPDGLTLMDRLFGPIENDPVRGIQIFGLVLGIMEGAVHLIRLTNKNEANPAQIALALSLGEMVTKQLAREGDICDAARRFALLSTNEDIISPEARQQLSGPPGDHLIDPLPPSVFMPRLQPPI